MRLEATFWIFGSSWRLTNWLWSILVSIFSVGAKNAKSSTNQIMPGTSASFKTSKNLTNNSRMVPQNLFGERTVLLFLRLHNDASNFFTSYDMQLILADPLPFVVASPRTMIDYIPAALQFNRKKLVLDLDETLISASQKHQGRHDISVRITINGVPSTFFIKKRPHVDFFLETVSQWFELVVFTASLSTYANAVIDQLDPSKRIKRRYFRHNCINTGGGCYVKDLSVVCRDMRKIVIIDNSPIAYSKNRENAIPIPDFLGQASEDKALLRLLPLLEEIRRSKDVRPVLRQRFNPQVLNRTHGAIDLSAIEQSFYAT